jgi:gliding motility-associated lipoprotein GldH
MKIKSLPLPTMKTNLPKALVNICFLVLLSSCLSGHKEVFDIENNTWAQKQKLHFSWEAQKGTTLKVSIKSYEDYPYCNIYLKATLKDGKGNLIQEKLKELYLNHPTTGKPLGSGFGNSNTIIGTLWKSIPPSKDGKYTLDIQQYMRTENLAGIGSIGIEVN